MAPVYTSEHDSRVEQILYRMMGVDPKADQRWPVYARSLFAFSAVSVLGLFALLRLQPHLPLSLGFPGVPPDQAFNTAASFVTNTNWQSCGPVASQEAIKQLGTNGVGFYNANSAHQFENPNPFSNFLQIFFLLLIPVTRTFGADGEGQAAESTPSWPRWALWARILAGVWSLEAAHPGTALRLAGASMEGKETRFGDATSALFGTLPTSALRTRN